MTTRLPSPSPLTNHHRDYRLAILITCSSLLMLDEVCAIRITDVRIPEMAIINSQVRLSCWLDMEEDTLYSLKWYLNGSEIASLTPSRNRSHELFPAAGVALSFAPESTSGDLLIEQVTWSCEGTWLCEVFADQSFQRDERVALITVIAPPTENPVISGYSEVYDMGDIVNVSCTPPPAKPLPRLSWFINGEPAPSDYILQSGLHNDQEFGTRLFFAIQVQHLLNGRPRLTITCQASFNYTHSSFETLESREIEIGSNSSFASSPVRISGLKGSYSVGDVVRLTCSYRGPEEQVTMHWLLNGREVQPQLVVRYKYHNYIGLRMTVGLRDLDHEDQLSVRCVASRFRHQVRKQSATSASHKSPVFLTSRSSLRLCLFILLLKCW